jgi:prevent-host-death family protein
MTIKKTRKREGRSGVSLLMLQSREINATEFKAHCLELMDEVERLGAEIVITKHRKPIARLVPVRSDGSVPFCGSLRGLITYEGDIVSPTGEVWDYDESNLT